MLNEDENVLQLSEPSSLIVQSLAKTVTKISSVSVPDILSLLELLNTSKQPDGAPATIFRPYPALVNIMVNPGFSVPSMQSSLPSISG